MYRQAVVSIVLMLMTSLSTDNDTVAQVPEPLSLTLNFRDVTSTHLNPTINEIADNDKSLDFGDYDNDGDLDAVVGCVNSSFGQRRNKLYRNDDGVLNEVSGDPVISGFALTDTSRRVFFEDLDQDGWLDIVVINDSNSGTGTINSPGRTKWFRNQNGVHFVNETAMLNNPVGAANSAVLGDFDGNGFVDLVMANHPAASQNSISFNNINDNGPGVFQDLTPTHMPSDFGYASHAEAADMNGDNQLDLLIANHTNQLAFIHYNNNENAGSAEGDFKYDGPGARSEFSPGAGGLDEVALVPGDFNRDGRMDFYFANAGSFGSQSDAVFVNQGNDDLNRAVFRPVSVTSKLDDETMKVTVGDLDGDGRCDVIVMSEFRRPYLLRNTTENGAVSFLEWTPAVIGENQSGWGGDAADLLGDDSPDLFIGANNGDFLYENVRSESFLAADFPGGQLPPLLDEEPIQVVGTIESNETANFVYDDLPAGARVSLLVRSPGDVTLVADDGMVFRESNRPGHATDEMLWFEHDGGHLELSVRLESLAYDGNGDGVVNLLDVTPFVDCLTGASTDCEPFDTDDDGQVTLLDVSKFVERLSASPQQETYSLEILIRSN